MQVYIPFCGFYNSLIDAEIDNSIENELSYFAECNGRDCDKWGCNYCAVRETIAKDYTKFFGVFIEDEFDIDLDIKFNGLISPKYYNFETDRILVSVSKESLFELYKRIDKNAFAKYVKRELTPRDGFIPFYSNDLNEWGYFCNWELPQLSMILDFIVDQWEKENENKWGGITEHYIEGIWDGAETVFNAVCESMRME